MKFRRASSRPKKMQADTAEKLADTAPEGAPKLRLLALRSLDHRTKAVRRAAALAVALTEELGGALSISQQAAVQRAALLCAISEDTHARRLGGDPTISLEDVVRVDGASARALKALGIQAAAAKPAAPNLTEYLASKSSEPAE
jgi:hypothetical protein